MRIYTPAEIQADICELEEVPGERLVLTNLSPCVRFRGLYSDHYKGKALSGGRTVDDLKKKIDDFIRIVAVPGVDLSPVDVGAEEGVCVYVSDSQDVYAKPFSFFARFTSPEEFDELGLGRIPDNTTCVMVVYNDYEHVRLMDRITN